MQVLFHIFIHLFIILQRLQNQGNCYVCTKKNVDAVVRERIEGWKHKICKGLQEISS